MQRSELWIGGEWVRADERATLRNPHTGEALADIGQASPRQAEQAITAAAAAFTRFGDVPAHERSAILYRVAEQIDARAEEIAKVIATEASKPIKAARGEVARCVQTYRLSAEGAKQLYGESIPMDAAPRGEDRIAYTVRRPLGVVTAITPFNFPLNLAAHKVGPAIAAGNSIVLKPAEQTPRSALLLAEIFAEAGLPAGVLNIIPGSGKALGEVLTTHPEVAFVTFTGSPKVGKLIRAQAGLRRVTLELGSNSPLIIDSGFAEPDLDRIADETTTGAFVYNGQVCISTQRVYVQRSTYEPFVDRLVARAGQLRIGDPLDEQTDLSALINEAAAERLKAWLDQARSGGAVVRCGGTLDGNVMHPTILTDVPADSEFNCEEAFGPVLAVSPFDAWDEAIAMANDSKYGLNAGVFTKDLQRALRAADRLESGAVLINQVPTFRVDLMPYGGIKESGTGREGVKYAIEEMTDIKLIGFRTGVYTD